MKLLTVQELYRLADAIPKVIAYAQAWLDEVDPEAEIDLSALHTQALFAIAMAQAFASTMTEEGAAVLESTVEAYSDAVLTRIADAVRDSADDDPT